MLPAFKGFRSGDGAIIRREPCFACRNRQWQKKQINPRLLPIYIINGPNLNLLGSREPEIYGRTTLGEIEAKCAERAKSHGLSIVFLQSNKEGELVEFLQEARTTACGVIINAAGYTHTSVAILDAMQMLEQPVIEVHLSNPARREDFRHRLLCRQSRHRQHHRAGRELLSSGDRRGRRHFWPAAKERRNEQQANETAPQGKKPALTPKAIRALAELLTETGLTEIEIEHNGARIRVARAGAAAGVASAPLRPPAPSAASRSASRSAAGPQRRRRHLAHGRHGLSAPRAGQAALRARSATAVKEGDTLFIVEAMKTMNPIPAPSAGTVKEICVDDGQPVEFGQTAARHRLRHVRKNPHRQSRRNRAARHPRLQGDGHRHRGGPFHRRRRRHACAAGRRKRLHRPAAGGPILSEHPRHHRRLRDHRRRGDPSRLRLSVGKRQIRRDRRGAWHHLHRTPARTYPHDGRQDHRQADGEGRSAFPPCPARTAKSTDAEAAEHRRRRSAIRC